MHIIAYQFERLSEYTHKVETKILLRTKMLTKQRE